MFSLAQLTKLNDVRAATLTPNWQPGVDAFFQSALASYASPANIPTGSTSTVLVVAPTFMMGVGYADQQAFKADAAREGALKQIASGAGIADGVLARMQQGRGTPTELRTLVQAIMNAQPANMTLQNAAGNMWQPLDVRQLMHGNALGFDCAGYVQQAYLAATSRTRDQLGWDTLVNEGLFNLAGHGFRKFTKVQDLRAGDIIVFNSTEAGQPGHRTIVFDQRAVTDSDKAALASASNAGDFSATGDLRVVEMDSSYGSWGHFQLGGVQRQMWVFNGTKWAHVIRLTQELPSGQSSSLPVLSVQDGLYGPGDKVEGFYRFRADG
jgi:hypothetical protein